MARLNPSARFWKTTRLVVGWGLIILIVAGLALLSKDRPWARRWLEQIKARLSCRGCLEKKSSSPLSYQVPLHVGQKSTNTPWAV
ncbi:MAG: hypothetical protein V3W10_05310, partial [candidate division NC10 bacterium]